MELTGESGKAKLRAETRDIQAAKRASKLRQEMCKGQQRPQGVSTRDGRSKAQKTVFWNVPSLECLPEANSK